MKCPEGMIDLILITVLRLPCIVYMTNAKRTKPGLHEGERWDD